MSNDKPHFRTNAKNDPELVDASLDTTEYQEISQDMDRIGSELDALLAEVTEFLNNN